MRNYCCQNYAPYPSMGFDPLQGSQRTVVSISLTDSLLTLRSQRTGRALAELSSTASRPRQSRSNLLPSAEAIGTYQIRVW
jgi:hypothetical protein